MRIVKDATERKNEILDAAEELFAAKGYDATSTGDILERVGIARGTLYYHFQSKEEILDALIGRINQALIARARRIAEDQSVPVVERIIRTIASMNLEEEKSSIGHEVLEQVHKPQNALMHQKMQQGILWRRETSRGFSMLSIPGKRQRCWFCTPASPLTAASARRPNS